MIPTFRVVRLLAIPILVLSTTNTARAERVKFHYPAADICAGAHIPGGPDVVGERTSLFGGTREPVRCRLRPTHLLTFCHPYTKANVTVPMRLPEDLPRVEHRGDRVIYNYGSYTVETVFLADGSVDVVYNSGLRPLGWCSR
ncbi:MAG TPA: hypothetical protein VEL76_06370 [Gemmataceae bacterium]|nr:hypothetical protein [Gemmataceae bacterium]